MLRHLFIKNFVLIDELSLDFEDGFSAFTGETGAGKSILIDAISLLRADRASASLIRHGQKEAIIEGTFDLSHDSHACSVLQEAGFDVQDETTFTRELHANGKSTARIDHRVVTLSLLRKCLEYEVDIHGQRDNAYLLDNAVHVHLLDSYLQDEKQLQTVQNSYASWRSLVREKDAMMKDVYNENDLDYFRFEIREIDEAGLKAGEDEELEAKEKKYNAVKDSSEKLHAIMDLYDNSLSDSLYQLNHLVQSLKSMEETDKIQKTVNDCYYALDDAMSSLKNLSDTDSISEEEINEVEERLFTIQKLKRKYGRTIEDILAFRDDLEKKVKAFDNRQEYLAEADQKIARARKEYEHNALVLSDIRKKGSRKLDQAVMSVLKDLMLPDAVFKTDIQEEKEPTEHGCDRVEFLISMNRGMAPSPLNSTASGGELSRLMLGLKVIFTRLQGIQTVIFDEIDTGVSGPVATAIGQKMHELSGDCQVFSVTHLAQVAACADHHYLVAKSSEKDDTVSTVRELNDEERMEQLALMASGSITEASLQAARELFQRNQK